MMDHGQQPDLKRQRVESWSSHSQERAQHDRPQLPPLPQTHPPPRQYSHDAGSPYPGIVTGPENPLNNHLTRRHSDQQLPYDPDSRRPTSGPHSGPHQGGPHQAPHSGPPHVYQSHHPNSAPPYVPSPISNMKREPEEPQQYNRPPSRGNGPEHNIGQPHGYGQQQVPSFEGQGPPPAIPFRTPGPPYANPHSPMAVTEGYHPSYSQPPQTPRGDMYSSLSYPAPQGVGQPKRKAQRAAQACDSCRNLKAKCDEGRPSCLTCKERNAICIYRDPPPKQQDKTQTDILESILEIKNYFMTSMNTVNKMAEVVQGLSGKMDRLEKEFKSQTAPSPVTIKEDECKDSDPNLQQYPVSRSLDAPIHDAPSPAPPSSHEDQAVEEEVGEPVKPGPSAIPVNHTTGAAMLLAVGPIAKLVEGLHDNRLKAYQRQYPMVTETNRGLLRVYGRGEGLDRPPGYEKEPLIDRGAEGTPSDTTSTSEAMSPPGEEWGQVGGMTPPPEPQEYPNLIRIKHEINSDGMPDLTRETIEPLVESYITHINIMHPILVPGRLRALVEVFLKSIPESHPKPRPNFQPVNAMFVGGRPPHTDSPGAKRKRSPDGAPITFEGTNLLNHKPGHPFRSISTCLVLLVLALGKICLHKGKLPDVLPEKDPDNLGDGSSPITRNGHPRSPMLSSPTLPTTGLPSPQEGDRMSSRSRRSSLEGVLAHASTSLNARNLDGMPGLSYFALASDILGNQIGGNSLQHVHAFILSSLYYGQLGRVMESSNHLSIACRALQVILRPKFERFRKLKVGNLTVPPEDNPLVFAFWTCLQLESDIVAELTVPMSGILNYEDDMPHPNVDAAVAEGFDARLVQSYSAQLILRKHLNQIHTLFYSPKETQDDGPEKSSPPHYPTLEAVQENTDSIKKIVPPSLKWNDDDLPAKDILLARLRAKYYGAQVITYRNFVLKILEHSAQDPGQKVSADFKAELGLPTINASATRKEELDQKLLGYAARGLKALENSTTAFYGLGDPGKERLIVTNIWGTAHAQWGNVLTLLAAYKDPILKSYIEGETLRNLLRTTLSFLELYSYKSSALRIDYKILEYAGRKVGLLPYKEPTPRSRHPDLNANTSFGSSSSGDVPMFG